MRPVGTWFLAAALFACTESGPDTDGNDSAVAWVGGVPILTREFERELSRLRVEGDETLISAATNNVQKRALIENLIDRKLVLRAAEAKNVIVGTDEVESEYERMKKAWPKDQFERGLQVQDLTPAELRSEIRSLLLVRRFFRDQVFSRVAVTAEEIVEFLEAHPERSVLPERVRARHIVVTTEEKAKEVLREIQKGLPFEEAAMQYSKSPEGSSGGELGFFRRGQMPKVFDEVCFGSPKGVVNKVVASDYGFHLFKVIEKRPETPRSASKVRDEVERELLEEKKRDAQLAFVRALRETTPIEIKEKQLATIY